MNVGSGGGAAAAAPAAGGAAAPAAADEKVEEKAEGMDTQSSGTCRIVALTTGFFREGGVRRGHGLRSLRLDGFLFFLFSRSRLHGHGSTVQDLAGLARLHRTRQTLQNQNQDKGQWFAMWGRCVRVFWLEFTWSLACSTRITERISRNDCKLHLLYAGSLACA